MEPVYRTLEIALNALTKAAGLQMTYLGLENIPRSGGAVIAINHTSYVDWLPAALAIHDRGRRVRYMIKAEMTHVKGVNFLIKHTKTIPVDRRAGSDAFAVAVRQLRTGELVGVMPEATISRSFELKEFKTGPARMALEADVPIIPMIVWGAQRVATKDHPRKLGRHKFPITVAVGPALPPSGDVDLLTTATRDEMTSLLHQAQQDYPHPDGAYWVPRRLGGSAPTPADAKLLDAAELAERSRSQRGSSR